MTAQSGHNRAATQGRRVWISLAGEGRLLALDPCTGACIGTTAGPAMPGPLCTFEGRLFVYNQADSSVTCFTDEGAPVWTAPGAPGATAVCAVPDGRILLAGGDSDSVVALDARDGRMLSAARVGGYPRSLDVSLGSGTLLVACGIPSSLHLLHLHTLDFVAECPMPYPVSSAVFDGAGSVAVLLRDDRAEGWLCRLGARLQLQEGRAFPAMPMRLCALPGQDAALVSHAGGVTALRLSDLSHLWTIGVDGLPDHIALDPNGRFAYVADPAADALRVIDLPTARLFASWSAGREPAGVAV